MKRVVLGTLAVLLSLYAVPAGADTPSAAPTPTVDLTTAPPGPETDLPFLELIGNPTAANRTFRLTAGAQTITFRRPFTGKDANGADTAVHLLGGGPTGWLIQDDVPHYVGGRTGYEITPRLYRLTPDGRTVHLTDLSGTDSGLWSQVVANERYYAGVAYHGHTFSIYRISTGHLVARRTFPAHAIPRLGPLVGRQLVVNVARHAVLWSFRSGAVRRLPGVVEALAGDTVVFQVGSIASLCSRVAPLDHPGQTLWTACGDAAVDSLSPDGQRIITVETFPRFGLRDRTGRLLAYYENGDGPVGWSNGSSTVTFSVDDDSSHPYGLAICTLADCHRDPGHANYLSIGGR